MSKERYSVKENKGLVDKLEKFNKITLVGTLLLASVGVGIAAMAAVVDASQLVAIRKYKKWRKKKG